jgi:acetyl esterase/lipase
MKATQLFVVSLLLASASSMMLVQTMPSALSQPAAIPLWPNGAPGAKGSTPEDIPSIQLYQPPADKANGSAIVVCPGGGYGGLAAHEGHDVAVWLNSIGVTAVVLKYRLGRFGYRHPVMLQDAQRAIRTTRAKAAEWKIDPTRVGIMGFSAGGHLTSTAATHFDAGDPNASDPIEKLSSRPDVAILCYPVITMTDPFTHAGSRKNLLGDAPSPELIDLLSNEKQVTEKTPPTFIFHTEDDKAVPVENSLQFAAALRKAKVPHEMHIYETGRHGVGLAPSIPALSTWPKLLENWLRARKFLEPSQTRISQIAPKKKRSTEIEALIEELRLAQPELAASSMINIASLKEVENDWKAELYEEAFRIAGRAQKPIKLQGLPGSETDTRTGYLESSYSYLKMDRLSLQTNAINQLIALKPAKARELWKEIERPPLPVRKCEEGLTYDLTNFYEVMKSVAQKTFSPEEIQNGEQALFLEQQLNALASPAEIPSAAKLIASIELPPAQLDLLSSALFRAMEKLESDDRNFSRHSGEIFNSIYALAKKRDQTNLGSAALMESLRAFLVKNLNAARCADNYAEDKKRDLLPPAISGFNKIVESAERPVTYQNLLPITKDEIKPSKIESSAKYIRFWETPQAKSVLDGLRKLRFGIDREQQIAMRKEGKRDQPLTLEERKTLTWHRSQNEFLMEISQWKPEHEKSETDYFNQKCAVYFVLVELTPHGADRNRMLGEFISYLKTNRLQTESFIEWFRNVYFLVRFGGLRESEQGETAYNQYMNLALDALQTSGDQSLQLYARVTRLLVNNKIALQ